MYLKYGIITLGNTSDAITAVTSDYTTLNSNVFLRHVIDSDDVIVRNDICFIKNNTMTCLKGSVNPCSDSDYHSPYYESNYDLLLEAFGPNPFENDKCEEEVDFNLECSDSFFDISSNINGDLTFDYDNISCGSDYHGMADCKTH